MFQGSKKRLLINLKTLSLFKLSVCLIIYVFKPHYLILFLALIYLFLEDKRIFIISIPLFLYIFLGINYSINVMDIGVVERIEDNYIIVQKPFYKVKLYTNEKMEYGSLISYKYVENDLKKAQDIDKLRENIFYDGKMISYKTIRRNNSFRIKIHNYIEQSYDQITSAYLKKFLLNENGFDNLSDFYLSMGFIYYSVLRFLLKRLKNKKIIYLFIMINTILFGLKEHFILLLIDETVKKITIDKTERFSLFIIIITLINPYLLCSYTYMIVWIIKLFRLIDNSLNFKCFMIILQSFLFSKVSLFKSFLYHFYILMCCTIYSLSILTLVIKTFSYKYLEILSFIEGLLLKYDIVIKGKINIICILLVLIVTIKFELFKNKYMQTIMIIIILQFKLFAPFTSISFIDVGQGDAILISERFNMTNILIDTGSSYEYYQLKKSLDERGIERIDCLIITHLDEDHSGNIENLLHDYEIDEINYNKKDIIIHPFHLFSLNNQDYENENDNSLVYYLSLNGISFIFMADVSKSVERDIIRNYGPITSDFIKIGHHGSKSSSDLLFLTELNARGAIISTNGRYNHPHNETIDRLNKLNINYYSTATSQDISFFFTNVIDFMITGNGEFVIINDR